jgi:hypothetical protein
MREEYRLRPDILDKVRQRFYEIKADNAGGRALGATQLVAYKFALARRFPRDIYLPGSWNTQGFYITKLPDWIGSELDFPIPGLIITKRVAPGLIVYDQRFIDLQAMMWGLAAYAAAPAMARGALKLAELLGKSADQVGKLADAAGKAGGGLGAGAVPAMGTTSVLVGGGFGFSIGFGF